MPKREAPRNDGARHRRSRGDTARESVLDEVTADGDFFLNVDLPVKYGTYLCLGFCGTCFAPLVFSMLGL
jgi:hypothetical protein